MFQLQSCFRNGKHAEFIFIFRGKNEKKNREVFAFTRWSPAETTGETGELVKINLPHDLLMVWEEWEFSGVLAGM